MDTIEILFIILGVVVVAASFVIPESFGQDKTAEVKIPEEKMREFLQKEMKKAEQTTEEKTQEIIEDALAKAERYMERVSNEKIMAVQEYSDTVLGQINKNHEEAVFLYDMLNNKQVQIKNMTAEIHNKAESVKTELENTLLEQTAQRLKEEETFAADIEEVKGEKKENFSVEEAEEEQEMEAGNHKSMILKLHEEGKSNVEIAKTLGLGIGEVKLIIGLYESAES